MNPDISSISNAWNTIWDNNNVDKEIEMHDFYGGRQYILKYLPRSGMSIEAGCGMGRYVFYLKALGFDILGADISDNALKNCKNWALINKINAPFFKCDVRKLPLQDNSITGYISLGVIEHFEKGPQEALDEARRVLKPGGIAIIYVPNKYSLSHIIIKIKTIINSLFFKKKEKSKDPIFEHKYTVRQLADFVRSQGFKIIESSTIDLKSPLYSLFRVHKKLYIWGRIMPIVLRIMNLLERTEAKIFGGLSIVVAYKQSPHLQCFFCSKPTTYNPEFSIPICKICASSVPFVSKYKNSIKTNFHTYNYNRTPLKSSLTCSFCKKNYAPHKVFKNYGFSVPVCPTCIKNPIININLSNYYLQEIWREYG